MPGSRAGPKFEIWQVGSRIHAVHHPARLQVLRLLAERPRRLADLVRTTRKAKSTLSVLHVRPLVSAGLIAESADPRDARAKVYRLRGHRLGSSDVDAAALRRAVLDYAASAGALNLDLLLRVVNPAALARSGASGTYIERVAREAGAVVRRVLGGTHPRAAAQALDARLRTAGLGRVGPDGRVRTAGPELAAFLRPFVDAALGGPPGDGRSLRPRRATQAATE